MKRFANSVSIQFNDAKYTQNINTNSEQLTCGAWLSTGVTVMLKRSPVRAPPCWSFTENTNCTKSGSGPISSIGGM